jgi:hypothetical protein
VPGLTCTHAEGQGKSPVVVFLCFSMFQLAVQPSHLLYWPTAQSLFRIHSIFTCAHTSPTNAPVQTAIRWTNTWDGYQQYSAASDSVITGIYSVHSNSKEDRLWAFYFCKIGCGSGLQLSGRTCTEKNECVGQSCSGHGTCVDGRNAFTCRCSAGWTGTLCQININDCSGKTCSNRGSCVDGVNAYSCSCTAGFTGRNCETNINECAGQRCSSRGTCASRMWSFLTAPLTVRVLVFPTHRSRLNTSKSALPN